MAACHSSQSLRWEPPSGASWSLKSVGRGIGISTQSRPAGIESPQHPCLMAVQAKGPKGFVLSTSEDSRIAAGVTGQSSCRRPAHGVQAKDK